MPKGGKLIIKTKFAKLIDKNTTNIDTIKQVQYALISVKDNGEGISNINLEKLFEPFFTTKEPGKGSGLGLAQVYGIVKQFKGTIEVESKINEGTEFKIYLPLIC